MTHKSIKRLIYISLGFSMFISLINHVINWIVRFKSKTLTSHSTYYNWKHGKIHFVSKGKGTPILLIHDLTLGASSFEFHKNIDTLSRHHKVYAIDLIGYGKSAHPPIVYTGYLMIQLITDFITDVIKSPCCIITSNHSSQYGIAVANISPNWVSHLIQIDPPKMSKSTVGLFNKLVFNISLIPILGDYIYNLQTSKWKLKQSLQKKLYSTEYLFTDYILEHYYVCAHLGGKNSKYVAASLHSNHLNICTTHLLPAINQQTTLMVSEENYHCSRNTVVNDCKSYPLNLTVEFFKDCHFYPHVVQSDLFNELTLEYLRK